MIKTIETNDKIVDLFVRVEKDNKPFLLASGIQKIEYDLAYGGVRYYDKLGNINFIHFVKEVEEIKTESTRSKTYKIIIRD